ncbi:hypothetical protein COY90_02275 [Candidatus Roizmanbacteria bacterium CG_4_10_14_0_8_um_filter_39_9]|uniref:DUF6922 domain-containing protein n=1 Tax=Candidatus Roizmanbacteria bacterium CG_4_10_14_0_8_um_filter_39_9 TaxID=1974829 RepID=A0A2M7QE19_9BACT|nr:MAG: hypothetical protein COY90_02275 [Candidatus Roizmanbacteria bacterium CG_4_10_14_0_8_um_filter_39_9]
MPSLTPQSVKAVLWSYDLNAINVQKDKKIIVSQVLNFGTEEAINWLFRQYGVTTVKKVAAAIPLFEWNKKSLSFWKIILSIDPQKRIV